MRQCALLFFLVVLSFCCRGWTADADASAKAKFEIGKQLFSEGDYSGAADSFRRAYQQKPTWKLLFNIGQAEAAAKRYGLALEAFEKYVAEAGDELSEERSAEVHREIRRLRDMVGVLNITTEDGAEVYVDDVPRGTAPIHSGIAVAAGVQHQVTVHVGDEILTEEGVQVLGGRTVELTLTIENGNESGEKSAPAEPAESTDAGQSTSSREQHARARRLKRIGAVTTGLGAASLVAGGITGAVSLKKNSDLKNNCELGVDCDSDYQRVQDQRNTFGNVSLVTLGVGVTAATVGLILLVKAKKHRDEQAVVATPLVGKKQLGIGLHIRF